MSGLKMGLGIIVRSGSEYIKIYKIIPELPRLVGKENYDGGNLAGTLIALNLLSRGNYI